MALNRPPPAGPRNIRELFHWVYRWVNSVVDDIGDHDHDGGDTSPIDHNNLTNVTPNQHHNQVHLLYGPDHSDVNTTAGLLQNDGMYWSGAEWFTGRRTKSVGDYVGGTSYSAGDELSDGVNLSECLLDGTITEPFVRPDGDPQFIYEGTGMANVPQSAKQIIFGNRYLNPTTALYLSGYRVNVVAGNTYVVYAVRDPEGLPIINQVIGFEAITTGWVEFPLTPVVVSTNTLFDMVVSVQEPDPTPVEVIASYDYQTPQNTAVPAAGVIVQARGQPDVMRINYIDDDAIDRTALIQGLSIGDTISAANGGEWSVQSNTDAGSYAAIVIAPALTGGAGTQDFTFQTVSATPISVPTDTAYWPTSSYPLLQGIIAVDVPYDSATLNTNAYGVDIVVEEAYVPDPTEWRLKIVAGTGGSGGGGDFSPTLFMGAGTQGYVPDPVSENDYFLRDDGTWAAQTGGSGHDPATVVGEDYLSIDVPTQVITANQVDRANLATDVTDSLDAADTAVQNSDVSVVHSNVPIYDGTTGRLIRDSGRPIDELISIYDIFTDTTAGVVPATGVGLNTSGHYIRGDGSSQPINIFAGASEGFVPQSDFADPPSVLGSDGNWLPHVAAAAQPLRKFILLDVDGDDSIIGAALTIGETPPYGTTPNPNVFVWMPDYTSEMTTETGTAWRLYEPGGVPRPFTDTFMPFAGPIQGGRADAIFEMADRLQKACGLPVYVVMTGQRAAAVSRWLLATPDNNYEWHKQFYDDAVAALLTGNTPLGVAYPEYETSPGMTYADLRIFWQGGTDAIDSNLEQNDYAGVPYGRDSWNQYSDTTIEVHRQMRVDGSLDAFETRAIIIPPLRESSFFGAAYSAWRGSDYVIAKSTDASEVISTYGITLINETNADYEGCVNISKIVSDRWFAGKTTKNDTDTLHYFSDDSAPVSGGDLDMDNYDFTNAGRMQANNPTDAVIDYDYGGIVSITGNWSLGYINPNFNGVTGPPAVLADPNYILEDNSGATGIGYLFNNQATVIRGPDGVPIPGDPLPRVGSFVTLNGGAGYHADTQELISQAFVAQDVNLASKVGGPAYIYAVGNYTYVASTEDATTVNAGEFTLNAAGNQLYIAEEDADGNLLDYSRFEQDGYIKFVQEGTNEFTEPLIYKVVLAPPTTDGTRYTAVVNNTVNAGVLVVGESYDSGVSPPVGVLTWYHKAALTSNIRVAENCTLENHAHSWYRSPETSDNGSILANIGLVTSDWSRWLTNNPTQLANGYAHILLGADHPQTAFIGEVKVPPVPAGGPWGIYQKSAEKNELDQLNIRNNTTLLSLAGGGDQIAVVDDNGEVVAGVPALSNVESNWLTALAEGLTVVTEPTTGAGWHEVHRETLAVGEAWAGTMYTRGKQTNGVGYYTAEAKYQTYYDGGAVTDSALVYELGPAINNIRAVQDGDDVVFQVRHAVSANYDWTMLLTKTDIT